MIDTTDPLVLDLLEWIAREPRLYIEVIETWRTSCPRLTIWEDAVDGGYAPIVGGCGRQGHRHRNWRTTAAQAWPRELNAAALEAAGFGSHQLVAIRNRRH